MRLLAIFGSICLLMVGLLAWGLWPKGDDSVPAARTWHPPAASRPVANPAVEATEPSTPAGDEPQNTTESAQTSAPATAADIAASNPAPAETQPGTDNPVAAEAVTESQPGVDPHDAEGRTPVHWAGTFDRRDAERRLDLALATLRDDPEHPEALRDAVTMLARLRRWAEAAPYLERLVEQQPDDAELRFEYGALLMRMRRFTLAINHLERAVELDPSLTAAWFDLAVSHQQLGHLGAARRTWDAAIKREPSAAARARRGEVLLDLGDWSAAAADFEAVLEAEPATVDVTLNLVTALEHLDRVSDAAQRLRDCLAAHPRSVPALNRLAALAWKAQQSAAASERQDWRDEVVDSCLRSLEIDANQPDVRGLLERAVDAKR